LLKGRFDLIGRLLGGQAEGDDSADGGARQEIKTGCDRSFNAAFEIG